MRTIIIAATLLASAGAWAAERLPNFPRNTDYGEARRSLIGLGYTPVTLPDSDKCEAGESTNLATRRPRVVKEMLRELLRVMGEVGDALPPEASALLRAA